MTKVGLRELKNRLGVYIAKVRAGQTVVVTDRGAVVAELTPPSRTKHAALQEMARRGELTLGKPVKDREALYSEMPAVNITSSSAELLNAERNEDR